jgi:hypothetical protein
MCLFMFSFWKVRLFSLAAVMYGLVVVSLLRLMEHLLFRCAHSFSSDVKHTNMELSLLSVLGHQL